MVRSYAEYHRKRCEEFRQQMADYKAAHGCIQCGCTDHRCLVFHHRDPGEKSFPLYRNAYSRSRASIEAELAKCDVMCANCHSILHYERGRFLDK